MDIVSRFGVKYSLLLITSIFPLLVSEFSFAMGGRSVPAGPDHPAPARHPGRCDRFADARGPLDSLRWQAAGQVVPLFRPLPHPQRSGSPVVVALIGAALSRGGRRPGRVFRIFRQIFAVLHPQDPLPIQPSPLQLFQTGIPSQVHNQLLFRKQLVIL